MAQQCCWWGDQGTGVCLTAVAGCGHEASERPPLDPEREMGPEFMLELPPGSLGLDVKGLHDYGPRPFVPPGSSQ